MLNYVCYENHKQDACGSGGLLKIKDFYEALKESIKFTPNNVM
jgi:hypothetical protein